MAEAAVSFLLDNLKDLLNTNISLIKGAKDEIENLEKDLRLFKAFLKDSTKKRKKDNDLFKEIMRQISDLVYEAEDTIDTFVSQAAEKKTHNYFKKLPELFNTPANLLRVAKKVDSIRTRIKGMYENNVFDFAAQQIHGVPDASNEEKKDPFVREDNVVGFEDVVETLTEYLMEEAKELDVISIIGMPGLGKTTVAGKIFRDAKIQFEIPTRIWVYVSQEYKRKDVFLSILKYFTRITDEMLRETDQEIAKRLREKHLNEGTYLIVMDDVWTTDAWEDLKIAFPMTNNRGKILITSRHTEVAAAANKNRDPYQLRFLTPEESWQLFQLEVFGKPYCPPELQKYGELIVKQCGRLPLAIVVIAGILVKKASVGEMNTREKAWEKVCDRVKSYLNEDPQKRMEDIISLSYNKLPYHLRPCFLYLAMFPEDFEIPIQELTLMWIAEGFIQKRNEMSLEDTAHEYLEELINRNLVMGGKRSLDGNIKTCRIHDMLREFCKNEAGNDKEKLLQEIKKLREGVFEPEISEIPNYRRLCIHSNVESFISSKIFGPRVRSFYSTEEFTLPPKIISSIPAAFKLLRVLDVKFIKFTKFPSDLTQLIHLRYIALSSDFKVLPDSVSKLWNIQTLIVDTTSRTLKIDADIWNMIHLRHLKTNASAILSKAPKSKEGGNKVLQTLGTISTQNCTEDIFDRASNLKKLGIRGHIAKLRDVKGLEKLGNLEKLKLVNDELLSSASDDQSPRLLRLPPSYKFPPKLRSLTLTSTYLEWNNMSTLAMLDSLEVLKLKDNAFVGESWVAADGGFRHLGVLHIERTDLAVWEASSHHFPILRRLLLWNCEKLEAIPFGLNESLQRLELKRCKLAVASAKAIEQANEQKKEKGAAKSGFKLYIAPGDE